MSYFSRFPGVVYPLSHDGRILIPYTMTDIMTRIIVDMPEAELISITQRYDITDGETIELVSNKLYGTPFYHWVIMLVNNIFDYIGDWYMSYDQLINYCEEKYGDDINSILYYTDEYGNIVMPGDQQLKQMLTNSTHIGYSGELTEVTNFAHESKLNEQRKSIRYIRPEFITQFINNFVDQINKAVV